MCQTENADARIVAANDLLRVLVDPEMARVMNYISQKLPMYLSGLPDATKNILANEVICGGGVLLNLILSDYLTKTISVQVQT